MSMTAIRVFSIVSGLFLAASVWAAPAGPTAPGSLPAGAGSASGGGASTGTAPTGGGAATGGGSGTTLPAAAPAGGGAAAPAAGGAGSTGASSRPAGMDCQYGVCFPTERNNIDLSDKPLAQVMLDFLEWLTEMFVFLAVAVLIICGIRYLTSIGDDSAAEGAKKCLKWALVGILVGVSANVIMQTIAVWLF